MNDMQDLRKALIRTGDGKCVLLWFLIFGVLLVRSIAREGLVPHQAKYIFFSVIVFLIFSRFRVSDFKSGLRTNIFGLVNVNGFGLFIIFMEFFNA